MNSVYKKLTVDGRKKLLRLITGDSIDHVIYLGIGTGSIPATECDVGLKNETDRKIATVTRETTTDTNDTLRLHAVFSFTSTNYDSYWLPNIVGGEITDYGISIYEFGIYDEVGVLIKHIVDLPTFYAINKYLDDTRDTLDVTIDLVIKDLT